MRSAVVLLLIGCREPVGLEPPDGPPAPIEAVDLARASGYQDFEVGGHFKRGRGCTFADFDGDERDDVFLSNPADESHVLMNRTEPGGPIRFEPGPLLAQRALAWAGTAADYDNDGDVDLFVGVGGLEGYDWDRLLRNELVETGTFTFTDVTWHAGVAGPISPRTGEPAPIASTGATFVDVDRDGFVDIWVDGHVFPLNSWDDLPDDTIVGRNVLWRNDGDGTFTDVTVEVGLHHIAPSRFSAWLDVDGDGDDDLFENNWDVAHNVMWRNLLVETGALAFEDATDDWSIGGGDLRYPLETFVSATEDLNADGWPDLVLFVRGLATEGPYTDGHVVLLNAGGRGFVDASVESNLNDPFEPGYLRSHVSLGVMGAQVSDMNGDGLPDVYVGNGGPSSGFADQLFLTVGLEEHEFPGVGVLSVPRFENRSELVDRPAEERAGWGPYPPYPYRTHGTCVTDLDGDGAVEIAVSNGGMSWVGGLSVREPNRLFELRRHPAPRWLAVDVRGDEDIGTDALATVVAVTVGRGDETWTRRRTVRTSNGFSAQNPHALWFGLGDAERVERVEVRWPDGRVDAIDPPALDTRVTVRR